jgi:nitroimidazol reductase NimA-like FMN-containing flavoprotein (pyridoxamine 5'-phosphate oxidase superfamily)
MAEYGAAMTKEAITEFLTEQGHGVLSFGGGEPYGLPISFGYNPSESECILQLVSGTDSRKAAAIEQSDAVGLTVYDWNNVDDWRSVIITGQLSQIPGDSAEAESAAEIFTESASVTTLAVFNQSLSESTITWYRLDIDEITGRCAQ